MRRVAGEVAHALDTEKMVTNAGAEYKIDPNDDKSLIQVLNTFRKQSDPDKLRAFGTEKQKVEALNQRRQDIWDQAYDTVQHMQNLKELQGMKRADAPKDPVSEWAYDFADQLAQAVLGLDPKDVAKTVILGLFTLAGADIIKDRVKDLDEVINKIEETYNAGLDKIDDFTTGELFTYTKTLKRLQGQYKDASTALEDALEEYHQTEKDLMGPASNNSREAAIVGAINAAVESSLGTMLAASKDMNGTPLLNTDLTKLLSPLGKYGGTMNDMIFYDNANVRKGFNVSGSVKQARIEEMAAALPDALDKLEALNSAIARLREWKKLLEHALKV